MQTGFGQTLTYNPIFDDTKLNSIYIIMDPDSLADMYDHYTNGHEYPATFIYESELDADTVFDIGIRLRGNTSLSAAKKSFKISFNTFNEGREYSGVKKLNLNGSHNDPSMVREKLYFDVYNNFGLPQRRSAFVRVYINDEYFGLYLNIEEMDEIFLRDRYGESSGNLYKCTWPSDLTWHGDNQDYYEEGPYDLQTNEQQNNYADLIHFIDVLNNTSASDFQCEIEKVFDVDQFLKIYALDISAGHWDNYGANNNNFFLYHNQFTDQFEFLSYDCDNTFGVDWLGIDWADRQIYNWQFDDRPLVDRILDVEEYRDKFSFYLNELQNNILAEDLIFPTIDAYRDLIDEAALEDVYRTYDFGYSYADFINSFFTNDIDGHTPYGVKNFITERISNTNDQIEVNDIIPIASNVLITPQLPAEDDNLQFRLNCLDDDAITEVMLWLMQDGLFESWEMFDDGWHNDSLANDQIYGTGLPALGAGEFNYHFELKDNTGQIRRWPFCDEFILRVGYTAPGLVVNELMSINTSIIADESGVFEDYIEIYNRSENSIYLGDKFLSDELDNRDKWRLPDMFLPSDNYLVIWADDDWEDGALHCSFKLDGDKDEVFIFDAAATYFALIDSISFVEQTEDIAIGRLPNGFGDFVVLPIASPGANNDMTIDPTDTLNGNTVFIYANPAYDILQFDLLIGDASAETSVELFHMNGQRVRSFNYGDLMNGVHSNQMDLSDLSAGLYFLSVRFNSKYITSKVAIY